MKQDYSFLKESSYFLLTHSKNIRNSINKFNIFDIPIIIVKDINGNFNGFYDICPHRGVPLSLGCLEKNYIQCSYHGWKFNLNGECIENPSQKNTPKYNIKSFNVISISGFIFVNFSNKKVDFNELINIDNYSFCYRNKNINADFIDVIENFLDPTHTPFIHQYLIRNPKIKKRVQSHITRNNDSVKIVYTNEEKQTGIISKLFEKQRGYSTAIFQYPCKSEINYYSNDSLMLKIKIYLTPINSEKLDAHIFFYFKDSYFKFIVYFKFYLIFPFFYIAIMQDKKILEHQYRNTNKFHNFKEIICESDLIKLHLIDLILNKNFTKKTEYLKDIYI